MIIGIIWGNIYSFLAIIGFLVKHCQCALQSIVVDLKALRMPKKSPWNMGKWWKPIYFLWELVTSNNENIGLAQKSWPMQYRDVPMGKPKRLDQLRRTSSPSPMSLRITPRHCWMMALAHLPIWKASNTWLIDETGRIVGLSTLAFCGKSSAAYGPSWGDILMEILWLCQSTTSKGFQALNFEGRNGSPWIRERHHQQFAHRDPDK